MRRLSAVLVSAALFACNNPAPQDGGVDAGSDGGVDGGMTVKPSGFLDPNGPMGASNAKGPALAFSESGTHWTLYSGTALNTAGVTPLRVGVCEASCAKADDFQFFTLADLGNAGGGASLALPATGTSVHVAYVKASNSSSAELTYASCGNGCGSPSNWKHTIAVKQAAADPLVLKTLNGKGLAVDATGKARILFTRATGAVVGTFVALCDSGCDTASNWAEVLVSTAPALNGSIALGSSGATKLVFTSAVDKSFRYSECAANCAMPSSWTTSPAIFVANTPHLSLALDSQSRPHVVSNQGKSGSSDAQVTAFDDSALYAFCLGPCTTAAGWTAFTVPIAKGDGVKGISLWLDSADKPTVGYASADGKAGYATCNASCQSSSPAWVARIAETPADLQAQQTATLPMCPNGTDLAKAVWVAGEAAQVARDKMGRITLAHEATIVQTCAGAALPEKLRVTRFARVP